MTQVPSIKGSAFLSVHEDVNRLLREQRIDPGVLATALTDKDRELLETQVTPLAWIPIESYGRMLELLAREEGDGDPSAYLRERGARAAERLLAGAYQGFARDAGSWGRRVGEALLGMISLLYNFTEWSFHSVDENLHEFRVSGASEYPDAARHTAEGFLHWFVERAAGRPMRVESRRTTPDCLVLRVEPA